MLTFFPKKFFKTLVFSHYRSLFLHIKSILVRLFQMKMIKACPQIERQKHQDYTASFYWGVQERNSDTVNSKSREPKLVIRNSLFLPLHLPASFLRFPCIFPYIDISIGP